MATKKQGQMPMQGNMMSDEQMRRVMQQMNGNTETQMHSMTIEEAERMMRQQNGGETPDKKKKGK